ncbi:MAG: hypothetical protein IJU19_08610 [Bacteroidales bacterium]|nr:hypothetical protein [Bacteroidales bacterium]
MANIDSIQQDNNYRTLEAFCKRHLDSAIYRDGQNGQSGYNGSYVRYGH